MIVLAPVSSSRLRLCYGRATVHGAAESLPAVFGKYRLEKRIASGGMAEVFLAHRIDSPHEPLVIKRILPHVSQDRVFVQMFTNEARMAALLDHPNIVGIHDFGKVDGAYFMAMEYVHGEDIRRIYNRAYQLQRSLPLSHSIRVIADAAQGLAYAHKFRDPLTEDPLNIVHRDVSPQNILVTYAGDAKVVDFGIATAAHKVQDTRAGQVKGKYSYMSPEQALGEALDFRTDIFALGIILYETTTGTRLFKRSTEYATLEAVRTCDFVRPGDALTNYPPELEEILLRALQKKPDDRWQDGAAFSAALYDFLYETDLYVEREVVGAFMRDLFADQEAEPPPVTAAPAAPSPSLAGPASVAPAPSHLDRSEPHDPREAEDVQQTLEEELDEPSVQHAHGARSMGLDPQEPAPDLGHPAAPLSASTQDQDRQRRRETIPERGRTVADAPGSPPPGADEFAHLERLLDGESAAGFADPEADPDQVEDQTMRGSPPSTDDDPSTQREATPGFTDARVASVIGEAHTRADSEVEDPEPVSAHRVKAHSERRKSTLLVRDRGRKDDAAGSEPLLQRDPSDGDAMPAAWSDDAAPTVAAVPAFREPPVPEVLSTAVVPVEGAFHPAVERPRIDGDGQATSDDRNDPEVDTDEAHRAAPVMSVRAYNPAAARGVDAPSTRRPARERAAPPGPRREDVVPEDTWQLGRRRDPRASSRSRTLTRAAMVAAVALTVAVLFAGVVLLGRWINVDPDEVAVLPAAQLTISTEPGATVYLEGRRLGVADAQGQAGAFRVPSGLRTVRVEHEGLGFSRERALPLQADQNYFFEIPGRTGWIRIDVAPWAKVAIDGESRGLTPLPRIGLLEGVHRIRLENTDIGRFYETSVKVIPGREVKIHVDLRVLGRRL